MLGLAINYSAYEAEIYRAGLGAIPIGQWEAAASLGMSKWKTFRRIIMPQTWRMVLPPMMGTRKMVALTSLLLVFSTIGWGVRVQEPTAPYWELMVLAFLAVPTLIVIPMSLPVSVPEPFRAVPWLTLMT